MAMKNLKCSACSELMCKGFMFSGLDIKHLVYMPIGHVVLKTNLPCKNFHVPGQYLYKPCKAYVYCWENKYKPWLKNHLPSRAHNHRFLCAVGQDLHAPGMWARLNVEPWFCNISHWLSIRVVWDLAQPFTENQTWYIIIIRIVSDNFVIHCMGKY